MKNIFHYLMVFFGDGYKDAKSLEKDDEANEFVRSEQGQQIIETLNIAL